jgi:hypothetical protein
MNIAIAESVDSAAFGEFNGNSALIVGEYIAFAMGTEVKGG